MKPHPPNGFTLVEVIVALLFLSLIAMSLTTTLVHAQQTRAANERWLRATLLAVEGMERLRAGHPLATEHLSGGFERAGVRTRWTAATGIDRLEVTVSWDDGRPHTVQLVSLARP